MIMELYTFEDKDGREQTFTTTKPMEAKEVAQRNGWKCIENTFEFSDSELAWDFTDIDDGE